MILVVGGIKGGSGKTTLATNLAAHWSSLGRRTLLIDADEQHSALDWAQQRTEIYSHEVTLTTIALHGKSIYQQVERMKIDYDEIIIDVGGRDTTSQRSALAVADKFLIPFKPRSFDVWTLGSVKKLIEEINAVNPKLLCYYVINQGDFSGSDNASAMEIISEIKCLNPISIIIGYRKAFSNAAAEGLSVWELKKSDPRACLEMKKCSEQILK